MPLHYSAARYQHSIRIKHIVRLAMEKLLAYESWETVPEQVHVEAVEFARKGVGKVLQQEWWFGLLHWPRLSWQPGSSYPKPCGTKQQLRGPRRKLENVSIYLITYRIYLIYLSASLKTKLFCETLFFELDNFKNAAILRDFLNFWTLRCQKRSFLRDFLNFSSRQHQERSKYARHPSKMESWVQSWRPCTNAFCVVFFFNSTYLKYCACHVKLMPGHTKCCTYHAKSSHQTYRSEAPKCNPSQNQRPNLLTSLINMSLVLRLPCDMHLCRSSSSVPRPPSFLEMPQNPDVLLTCGRVENPLRLPHKTTLQHPNVARTCDVLYILTSKCPSRRNGVHFLDISTSKSGRTWSVLHVLTWKCASRHNSVHFLDISASKVVRTWGVLCILTWKCASRHNGVQFFISHLHPLL